MLLRSEDKYCPSQWSIEGHEKGKKLIYSLSQGHPVWLKMEDKVVHLEVK